MAEEGKGVALAILGIVAVIAVVGLILLFKGGTTGNVAGTTAGAKIYGGGEIAHGLDQYQDPEGYVRYSTPRPLEGEEYIYSERIKDSGDNPPPEVTLDSNYRRTGPIMDNPCPYPPYTDKVTALYAAGRECMQSEMPEYQDFYCCI